MVTRPQFGFLLLVSQEHSPRPGEEYGFELWGITEKGFVCAMAGEGLEGFNLVAWGISRAGYPSIQSFDKKGNPTQDGRLGYKLDNYVGQDMIDMCAIRNDERRKSNARKEV